MSKPLKVKADPGPSITGALLLGTGLAFASLILIPALATHLGMGPSLTGALRIALMKASHRAIGKSAADAQAPPANTCCH
ncbi:MAG: hypothetical protein PHE55_16625 [Methylococcaceae bacterium]|nr:hypothetical protein [Methylococcaceae bacterium]